MHCMLLLLLRLIFASRRVAWMRSFQCVSVYYWCCCCYCSFVLLCHSCYYFILFYFVPCVWLCGWIRAYYIQNVSHDRFCKYCYELVYRIILNSTMAKKKFCFIFEHSISVAQYSFATFHMELSFSCISLWLYAFQIMRLICHNFPLNFLPFSCSHILPLRFTSYFSLSLEFLCVSNYHLILIFSVGSVLWRCFQEQWTLVNSVFGGCFRFSWGFFIKDKLIKEDWACVKQIEWIESGLKKKDGKR